MSTFGISIRKDWFRVWLPPLVAALLFAGMLGVLHHALHSIRYRDVRAALAALPASHILWALLLTAANYLVLSGYDHLGFHYIGKPLARWRISATAAISFAVSNSVGFSLLSGSAIRHRFYSRWGLTAPDLARIVALNTTTFWLGLTSLVGGSLIFYPHAYSQSGLAHGAAQALGMTLVALVACYFVFCRMHKAPLQVRGFEMRVPSLPLALGQWLVSLTDWVVAAAVLYTLLPEGRPPFGVLLGAFLTAQALGLISNVPGGLGVFEGSLVLLLGPYLPVDRLLAALVLYRVVYYVAPLFLALLTLLGDELHSRRTQLASARRLLSRSSVLLAPRILALFTFLAGGLLLVSGATPAEHARMHWMARVLPLSLFEASHFFGSVVGVGLLVLAQAVSRRIRVAYILVVAALLAGMATSVLKAGDWEEAILLGLLLLVLVPSASFFNRRAALFDTRFSPGWVAAILGALGTSIWLGIFVFRHVEYANELWWKVALDQDAPRFLRATLGAIVTLLGFSLWRLLRPPRHVIALASDSEIVDARRIIATQSYTLPHLVNMRDKGLVFNDERTAFIMYGVHGRTWVSLGDPVGPIAAAPDLIRTFIERADDAGGVPVFYQIRSAQLHLYAELGMSFAKLGEEGHVALHGFSLEGSRNKDPRGAINRLSREHVTFRVIEPTSVALILPQLKAISDDWLTRKSASEKGFSLGFFDADYLCSQPVAVLEKENRIVAFANLLCGPAGEELSVDLMRFSADAPPGAMDGLFTHLFLWAQAHGYGWFNLGMAPLSGLQSSPIATLWTRLGDFTFRHGESFYNFEGLRAYKDKFHPVWEPRYLAYPGGVTLPLVMADIVALTAGGYLRIFR